MKIIDSPGKQQTQQERFEKIRALIFPDSSEASRTLASEVAALIRNRQEKGKTVVLGLATGSTPVPFYRELIRLHKEEGLSFQNVVTFNLDEYFGLNRDHRESYSQFMRDQLFDHIDVPEKNINIPEGTLPIDQVYEACKAYEEKIQAAGGLDLQILGIGRTGHIGFNEPGSSRDSITRMITLDRVTRQDAAPDFLGVQNVPRFAVTMGVGTILQARRIVLMAWGENKAEIVREAVENPVTDQVSASFLQDHENATFLVDTAAASRLTRLRQPWLVGSVTWDDSLAKRAVIWMARKLDKPVLKLVDEEYNESGVGELLTASGPAAYHVNIDVFNQLQHSITGWPGGKPEADDSNRPERAQPFPKRVLILSPEPHDAVVGMGGTIERLVDQGHEVRVAVQTSGNLRVNDIAAYKFASVVLEMANAIGGKGWEGQAEYARSIVGELENKGAFGLDPERLRKLKGLILRGEARDALRDCGVASDSVSFLDLPFYETGRYRRFSLEDEDVNMLSEVLNEFQPHQIYATGNVADPSSLQALSFLGFERALNIGEGLPGWFNDCRVWIYRGKESAMEPHEIDMAVPLSPDQLDSKAEAIRKFQSINPDDFQSTENNRSTASEYDALGMAEYEAIESFQCWLPSS